ncbi:MAG: glycosyltransferase [Pseudomonadota bacterium]
MPEAVEPRILWITDRYPPLEGGMAVSCARQVEGLRSRGLQVEVIAFTRTNPEAGLRPRSIPRDCGADHHLNQVVEGEVRAGLTAQRAWRLVLQEQAEKPFTYVVGFGAGHAGALAVTLAAWLSLPSLVLVRGNDFDQDWFDPLRGLWVREALGRAAMVGVVAPEMGRRIQALLPGAEVCFTPNGVDVSAFELLPQDKALRDETRAKVSDGGRQIIGLFGELKYKKGVAFWLEALREAGLKDRIGLLVVGKRIDEETARILEDSDLAPPSLRLPYSDRDNLPWLYAAGDFVALPSLVEGMPNVLLEAMGCGVIPIVSDAGAMGELVKDGETGFIFPAQDRRAAAEATARALDLSQADREALSRRARDFVARNFSVQKELDVLCSILFPRPG